MNTTVLTDEQIIKILEENRPECDGPDKAIEVSRAIEQAVLQSEQVQAWKRDAERYRYIKNGTQWVVAATQTGHQISGEELDDLIDSEMEQQK